MLAGVLLATCSLGWQAPSALAATPMTAMVPAPAPGVVYPARRSNRVSIDVKNLLPYPVTRRASDIDCRDWSHTGNPSNIDGVQMAEAGRHTWTMEAGRLNAPRRWRLTGTGDPESGWKGSARLQLQHVLGFDDVLTLQVIGGDKEAIGRAACTSTFIAPTTVPASTGLPTYKKRDLYRLELLLFSDGSHIVMRACS
jgi:hypothetical protein